MSNQVIYKTTTYKNYYIFDYYMYDYKKKKR